MLSEWFWSGLVDTRLWEHNHFQVASTRPIARHIINDRDHAAGVLLVSYCGPAYERQTKTALIAYGQSDLGGRCEARIDLERVDGVYLRAASTFAHHHYDQVDTI